MDYNLFIGIDPGKDGGLVFQSHDDIVVMKTPQVSNEIDINTIIETFENIIHNSSVKPICVLEDVHAIFGSSAKATFGFGESLGIMKGILAGMKIPYVLVAPKKWQAKLFEGIREQRKPNKGAGGKGTLDTKPMALLAAKRLYPKIDLRGSERSKNPHEGIVDALCISHYCKITYSYGV